MRGSMDESILRVLGGRSDTVEARRVAHWRAESTENDAYYDDIAAIWEAAGPDVPAQGSTPQPPPADQIVRRGGAMERRQIRGGFARGMWRAEVWPLAAAALIAAAGLGLWVGRAVFVDRPQMDVEYASGAVAMTVPLTDGSVARLAPGTRLRVRLGDEERTARLAGRAFFAVAADPRRPFTVETDGGRVRVTGTRFEVSSGTERLRVILVEGEVGLETEAGHTAALVPGQVATWTAAGDFAVTSPADLPSLLDWPAGLLLFQATPLPAVARELSAHFGVPVVVDSALASRTVTGWFEGEGLEEVAGSLCLLVQARCSVTESEVRLDR